MQPERYIKEAFTVIGKEGSSVEGEGFVQRLWEQANANFAQVQPLAKKDANGTLVGSWGVMTDFSRSFQPWENHYTQGLYLAGVECEPEAEPPAGWSKWTVPGYEYLRVACVEPEVFSRMITYLQKEQLPLAGAVQDYTCPLTGKNYMLFPIRKL